LIRLGELASEPPSERKERIVGCNRGDAGDDWLAVCGTDVKDSVENRVKFPGFWYG
jgi:hypothetical protein